MPKLAKQMTRDQTQYYATRFRSRLPDKRIAEKLGVALTTWTRWANNEGLPPFYMIKDFRDLLHALCKNIVHEARGPRRWEARIADVMLEDPEPEWQEPAIKNTNPDVLEEMLIELCLDKKGNSNRIFDRCTSAGFSRMQVYSMADKLGIMREQKKFGRNGYSLWTLRLSKKKLQEMGYDV